MEGKLSMDTCKWPVQSEVHVEPNGGETSFQTDKKSSVALGK